MRLLRSTASILLILLLMGCSGSPASSAPPAVVQSGASATNPVIRVLNLDLVSTTPAPTRISAPTPTAIPATPALTALPQPTESIFATPTPLAEATGCGDQAEFIRHLSVSPGTLLQIGQWIAKVWQVKNTGGCTWTSDYALRYVSGETFGAALSQPLPQVVQPGETIDLRLVLLTPFRPGDYSSEWALYNPAGETVPIASFDAPEQSALWISVTIRLEADPDDKSAPDDDCG